MTRSKWKSVPALEWDGEVRVKSSDPLRVPPSDRRRLAAAASSRDNLEIREARSFASKTIQKMFAGLTASYGMGGPTLEEYHSAEDLRKRLGWKR